MKPFSKLLFLLLIGLSFNYVHAQSYIISRDTTVCVGQPVTLHAYFDTTFTTLGLDSIDDVYSSIPINIGFPFTFYGNTYTQCLLSSNAYICFDISQAGNYSQYPIGAAIPSTSNPVNSIFGVWHDVDPSVPPNGIRTYLTTGIAPNRKFVYTFCNVPMFSCNSLTFTGQIILYEGSNDIDIHVGNKVVCSTWNGGYAILGLQDATGTNAAFPAGYNYPTVWTATNQSWHFTWNGTNNYNVSTIPYNPIPVNIGGSWLANGTSVVGTDSVITVTPTATTQYSVASLGCAGSTIDTVTVTVINISATPTITPANCSTGSGGNAIVHLTSAFWPLQLNWYNVNNGQNLGGAVMSPAHVNDTLPNLNSGLYAYVITDTFGCTIIDTFPIAANNFPPFTFNQVNTLCPNSTAGMAICQPASNGYTYTYTWSNATHMTIRQVNSSQADTLKNCKAGTYYVTISIGPNCSKIDTFVITTVPFSAAFTYNPTLPCALAQVNFSSQSIGTVNNYTWVWGDGTSPGSGSSTTHNFATANAFQVQLIIQGAGGCSDTAKHVVQTLRNISADFAVTPTLACIGQTVYCTDNSDCFPVGWQWRFGDGYVSNIANNASHAYAQSGNYTIHLLVVDSLCGSDSIQKMISIAPPPPISLGPDWYTCINTSIPITASTTATQYSWSTGAATASIVYSVPQDSSWVTVTVTSQAGCQNSDSVLVIGENCNVFLPSTFSPNGDQINDVFKVLGQHIVSYEMHIYDRWGVQLYAYSGSDLNAGWDGTYQSKPQENGTYIYTLKANFINGNSINRNGDVTILK